MEVPAQFRLSGIASGSGVKPAALSRTDAISARLEATPAIAGLLPGALLNLIVAHLYTPLSFKVSASQGLRWGPRDGDGGSTCCFVR